MSRPASEGPTAGANPITRLMMPMALPRFSRGKISRMTVNTIGMTAPGPAACSTRPSSKNGNEGATAAHRLPSVNSVMPPKNSWRVEKRPIKYAAKGMITASVSE